MHQWFRHSLNSVTTDGNSGIELNSNTAIIRWDQFEIGDQSSFS